MPGRHRLEDDVRMVKVRRSGDVMRFKKLQLPSRKDGALMERGRTPRGTQ